MLVYWEIDGCRTGETSRIVGIDAASTHNGPLANTELRSKTAGHGGSRRFHQGLSIAVAPCYPTVPANH